MGLGFFMKQLRVVSRPFNFQLLIGCALQRSHKQRSAVIWSSDA
jgi:hypothetical protein